MQVGSREFSVVSHGDNALICPIAHVLHDKSHYPCKRFSSVLLKFSNWSWDAITSVVCLFSLSSIWPLFKGKKCSAAEDLSHDTSNGEKEGNQSDEALEEKRREEEISLMKH